MNKIILGSVIAGVLAVAGFALSKDTNVTVSVPEQRLGALADIPSPYFTIGEVRTEYRRQSLNTATNTPCAILSPAATSTIEFANIALNTASSTATTWKISKSATAFATTTLVNTYSLASGALATFALQGTTTESSANVIGPSQYLVWNVEGTVIADSAKFNGTCQAEFRVI